MSGLNVRSSFDFFRRLREGLIRTVADERMGRYRCIEMTGFPPRQNVVFRWHARRLSTMQLRITVDEDGEPLWYSLEPNWEDLFQ